MTPSTRTVMRLRYVARLAARVVVLALVILSAVKTWGAVDQYIAYRSAPKPGLPAGVAWSPESNFVRQMYEPVLWLGLAVALVVLEGRLVGWLVPVPSRKCPGCGYSLEKLEGDKCPECGLELGGIVTDAGR